MISKWFSRINKDYDSNPEQKRRIKNRFLLFLGLLLLIGVIGIGSSYWKNSRTMQNLIVEGNLEVKTDEIKLLSNLKNGILLMSVSPSAVRRRLLKNSMIETAIVTIDLPSTVKIKVKERTPIARFFGEKPGMIDGRGYGMPEMKETFYDLPVISGISTKDFEENWGLSKNKQVVKIARFLYHAKHDYPVLYYLISDIMLNDDKSFQMTTQDGAIPLLMNYENALVQMVYFKEFWVQVIQIEGAERFKYVDLRADNVITAKEL